MLAVSHIRDTTTNGKDESLGQAEGFRTSVHFGNGEFSDFSDGALLESIDFDDLFLCIDDDGVLPDLEMDPELFAEFSLSPGSGDDSDVNTPFSNGNPADGVDLIDEDKVSNSGSGSRSSLSSSANNGRDEKVGTNKDGDKGRKSSGGHGKNNKQGKRKVDWTPELHRRFVQAVEQLGVDKAVPSRILKIMGIDCLTRHNIASHLQKYRSHRKHLLAREAEAASWSQQRQMYGGAAAGGGGKRNMTPWLAPTMGFPPITPMHHPHHHFRPLHVWGHPSMDQSLMHIWPKHLPHSPSPPPRPPPPSAWAAPLPARPDPSFWNHHNHQQVPNGVLTPCTPCFPQPLPPPTRFAAPTVPVIPPHPMHKEEDGIGVPPSSTGQSAGPRALFDILPSKESIDAAIGDVISKPWLPLPLGLKPPSVDGVLVELQRQGVPKIPPTSCA